MDREPCAHGVLVVDKPKGPTSHDVVARARRALATRQVGHTGTLDPMATGVLVLAVGEATKLVPWLTASDKTYEARLRLGVATDSLDADGTETARVDLAADVADALAGLARRARPDAADLPDRLARALERERARTEQVPPAFSAVRIGGERAHALARRGEAPELAPRPVSVKRLVVCGGGLAPEPHLDLLVEVSKGYFVRALARDLAEALGTVGHLTALRRTRSGAFSLDDAVSLDDAGAPADEAERERRRADLRAAVVPLAQAAARALPVSALSDAGVFAARRGQRVAPADLASPHRGPSAWLDASGALVAVGEADAEGAGRVLRGFNTP